MNDLFDQPGARGQTGERQTDLEALIAENMDDDDIRDAFDTNPNLTLAQLARMAMRSVPEIKKVLLIL